jgi:hypothetical protein
MWLLWKLAPDTAAYHIVLAVRLRGGYDRAALTGAVDDLVARHDLLRSRFVEVAGEPRREVGTVDPVRLEVRAAAGLTDDQLYARVGAVVREPFALDAAAPFRAVLLDRGPVDAVLVLVTHHIAGDATSQWLLARDLFRRYAGERLAPAGSYDAHVRAEAQLLASPEGAALHAYWQEVCAGTAAAELPTDRPRPVRARLRGSSLAVRFDPLVASQLRTAAVATRVTPFGYLVGVFQALVYRHTGRPDFLIGCPTTIRHRRELRDLVGYLANSTVLRASFDRSTTYRDAVTAAHRATLAGLPRARYPFELVGSPGAPPLFRLAFTLLGTDLVDPPLPMALPADRVGREIEYAGLRLALVDVPQMEGQFDLLVEVRYGRDGLTAVFKYDTDLFDPATVNRLAEQYRRMVELAVDDPDLPVSRFALVDRADLAQLLAMGAG